MGNIQSLNRNGTGAKEYRYVNGSISNQLKSVAGLTVRDYEYDANGPIGDGKLGIELLSCQPHFVGQRLSRPLRMPLENLIKVRLPYGKRRIAWMEREVYK